MNTPLSKFHPYRTRDVAPDIAIHGDTVLAWSETYSRGPNDYVEASTQEVRAKPKEFQFWLPERRSIKRN